MEMKCKYSNNYLLLGLFWSDPDVQHHKYTGFITKFKKDYAMVGSSKITEVFVNKAISLKTKALQFFLSKNRMD